MSVFSPRFCGTLLVGLLLTSLALSAMEGPIVDLYDPHAAAPSSPSHRLAVSPNDDIAHLLDLRRSSCGRGATLPVVAFWESTSGGVDGQVKTNPSLSSPWDDFSADEDIPPSSSLLGVLLSATSAPLLKAVLSTVSLSVASVSPSSSLERIPLFSITK